MSIGMARKSQQVETRMVSEYMLAKYANFPFTLGVPLGSVPEHLAEKEGSARALGLMRPYRPEVDAVVYLPRFLVLIEAKVWNILNGLAKLPFYKSLVPITPELQEYKDREVIMHLVVGWTNANLEHMARDAGVEVHVFNPPWLQEVVDSMHKYWTPEYRREREQKLQLREHFGLD